MEDTEKYENMVKYYSKRSVDQNILEIIQKESSETVLVNAASYFLHPKRGGHLIDNKMLQNLMDKIGKDYPNETGEFICMKNEFPCEENDKSMKRLDLLLEFEKHCIGIEAKVNSKLNNPLKEYSKSLVNRLNGRKYSTLILVKKNNKKTTSKALEKKNKDQGEYEKWDLITWSDLVEDVTYNKTYSKNSDPHEDLINSLIKIEDGPSGLEDIEEEMKKFTDERLELLEDEVRKSFTEYKVETWYKYKNLRQIIEPRLVIEREDYAFKIDVCVGIRGLQFVVFKRSGYCHKLFKAMCRNYPFYYWQDYLDQYELYNRYVIRKKDKDVKNGPLFPNQLSVKMEETVIIRYQDDWTTDATEKLKEIIEKIEDYIDNNNI